MFTPDSEIKIRACSISPKMREGHFNSSYLKYTEFHFGMGYRFLKRGLNKGSFTRICFGENFEVKCLWLCSAEKLTKTNKEWKLFHFDFQCQECL